MKRRLLMVGAGGFAHSWIRDFLPGFLEERIEVAGLVDRDDRALDASGDLLGLSPDQRFNRLADAFREVEADFCAIVIPPVDHRHAVMLAVEHGMHILSEKPIADTLDATRDIHRAVTKSGLKMAVTQNYRFTQRMLTFRRAIRDDGMGALNYLMARFAADYRTYGSWGAAFRHDIADALLIEGAVHHFDMIRNLADADCETIAGISWNPSWSSFKGDSSGLFVMGMSNGSNASYEGNCSEAGIENSWHQEYYRAECKNGAVALDADGVVRIIRDGEHTECAASIRADRHGHQTIIRDFLNWLDGGPEPETSLRDNIKSMAMIFAAIDASRERQVKRVADYM
jgi:predicted dehydrogenase